MSALTPEAVAGPATPETEARRHADEQLDMRIRRIVRDEIAMALTLLQADPQP